MRYLSNEKTLIEYPVLDMQFVRGVAFPTNNLARTGADFDGDSVRGLVVFRIKSRVRKNKIEKNKKSNFAIDDINKKYSKGDFEMPIISKDIVYNKGLINIADFPRKELIEIKGNTEHYKVPNGVEVLTIWNGKEKWVKPKSFSIHKNLRMLSVKTHKGSTLEVSDEHSLVTLDDNLNYIRTNPLLGMCIPRSNKSIGNYDNIKYKTSDKLYGFEYELDEEAGYVIGLIVGDGWVNHLTENGVSRPSDIMLATTTIELSDAISNFLAKYGWDKKRTIVKSPHIFKGFDCYSEKHTWRFLPFADVLREYIGHGANNKKLPYYWQQTTNEFRWGLLAGLIDTDGTVTSDKNGRVGVAISTTSETLAYQTQALANSLGMIAGIYNIKRVDKNNKKEKIEYNVGFSNSSIRLLKKHLKIRHPKKVEKLENLTPKLSDEEYQFTPNIAQEKLMELLLYVRSKRDTFTDNRIRHAMRKSEVNDYKLGGYMTIKAMKEIMEKYPVFFRRDNYWKKLVKIVYDENISWEVIREITEAYDLTVPPYNTFVMQNGIVVYDTVSTTFLYTEESKKEVNNLLNNKFYYIAPDGSFTNAPSGNKVVELVLQHMTSEPNVNANKEEHVVESAIGTLETPSVNNTLEYGMVYADEIKDSNNPVTVTKDTITPIEQDIENKYDKLLKANNIVLLFNADTDHIDRILKPSTPVDYISVNKTLYPTINRDKRIRVFDNISYATTVMSKNNELPRSAVVCKLKNIDSSKMYTPTSNDIPYVNITHEKWYTDNVEIEPMGEILFTGIINNENSDMKFNVLSSKSLTGNETHSMYKLQFIIRD